MANPLSVEPDKSATSKDKSSNKKLKEIDGTAVSTGSGDSKRTSSRCLHASLLFLELSIPVSLLVN
jgi:hypothetical protein